MYRNINLASLNRTVGSPKNTKKGTCKAQLAWYIKYKTLNAFFSQCVFQLWAVIRAVSLIEVDFFALVLLSFNMTFFNYTTQLVACLQQSISGVIHVVQA